MKKLLILILALCLVFVGALAWLQNSAGTELPAPEQSAETEEPAQSAQPRVDFEALYKAYPADTVYAKVGEREITWGEYYEWLGGYILSTESSMDYMQSYYGITDGWDAEYAEGVSLAEATLLELNDNFLTMTATEAYAASKGVSVGAEELEAERAEYIQSYLGEGATEEEWAALLKSYFLTDSQFRAQLKADLLLTRVQEDCYGLNGETLSAARLQRFLEDYDLICCSYLVFLTVDPQTLAPLESDAAAEITEKAEAAAAELQAVSGSPSRIARFKELAAELQAEDERVYCVEDLVFQRGAAADVIETGCAGLGEGEVSALQSDQYGYYLFIRLPITAETMLDDGSLIGAVAARSTVLGERDELAEGMEFAYAAGIRPVDLLDYLK